MKRIFIAALTANRLQYGGLPAADMPVKAPVMATPVYNGSGWYVGLGTEAAVAQANVGTNNLFATSLVNGDLKAAGGAVKGVAGYVSGNPTRWWRVEASVAYQNIAGADAVGGVASRWSSTQEVDVGFELFSRIFSVLPNLGVNFPSFTPQLPSNILVQAAPRQYVGVGAREFGLDGSFLAGSGSTWSVAPMLKSGYLWQTIGANGQPNGGALDAYAWVAFPAKGFTVNNVLSPGGAPMIASSARLGTQYGLGLSYAFGISN